MENENEEVLKELPPQVLAAMYFIDRTWAALVNLAASPIILTTRIVEFLAWPFVMLIQIFLLKKKPTTRQSQKSEKVSISPLNIPVAAARRLEAYQIHDSKTIRLVLNPPKLEQNTDLRVSSKIKKKRGRRRRRSGISLETFFGFVDFVWLLSVEICANLLVWIYDIALYYYTRGKYGNLKLKWDADSGLRYWIFGTQKKEEEDLTISDAIDNNCKKDVKCTLGTTQQKTKETVELFVSEGDTMPVVKTELPLKRVTSGIVLFQRPMRKFSVISGHEFGILQTNRKSNIKSLIKTDRKRQGNAITFEIIRKMAIGFSLPFFFVIFRECTEASIVVSVLLAFVYTRFSGTELRVMRRRLTTVIWIGTGVGLLASMAVGGAFLGVWFTYANNLWNQTESLWEAIFSLIACVLLTAMAFAFLKSDELTAKWHRKLHKSLADQGISGTDTLVQQQDFAVSDTEIVEIVALTTPMLADENINPKKEIANIDEKSENEIRTDRRAIQVFFWIPFVTVLREGLEGIVFLGGLTLSESADNIPLAVIVGLICGCLIGWAIFRAGNSVKLHTFFVSAAVFIFYLSGGLLAKSISEFELNAWTNAIGGGSDDSSYWNVKTNVWHVTCCDPEDSTQGGWQFFNAVLGWSNNATYASVTCYAVYWCFISGVLVAMKLLDRRRRRLGKEKVGFKKMVKSLFIKAK